MSTRRLLPGIIAPGLVLTLIAVQIAFGVRGFDNPKGGFAAILEIPGVIAGWGGILFLFPVLVWLILDWWGFGPSSLALRCLGAGALALAAGSLFGLFGGAAFGGSVGTGLADLLQNTVGFPIAIVVLAAMAIPGLILAFAGFGGSSSPKPKAAPKPVLERTPDAAGDVVAERKPLFSFMRPRKKVSNLADLVRDAPKEEREPGEAWYPSQQFSDEGDELPMDFAGARDVGGIRYADDAEPDDDVIDDEASEAETETVEIEEEPQGRIHVDGNGAEVVEAEVVEAETDEEDDGVEPEVFEPPEPYDLEIEEVEPDPPPLRKHDATWDDLDDEADDEPLLPGVRYAESSAEPAPATAEAEAEESTTVDDETDEDDDEDEALHDLMRGKAPTVEGPSHSASEVRESMRNTLLPEQMQEASKRYLKKLESSGIFDFLDADDEEPAPPKAKPVPKKPAAKRKKAAAKKKATKKKAPKKRAAKKKAAKKKAAKKSSPKKRAKRKTAARRTTPPKATAPKHRFSATGESSEEIAASLGISVDMHRRLSRESVEPLFAQAVEIALERGAASPVLLTRRMGIGFTGAKKLVQRLVEAGVLGDMNVNGSHPTRLTRDVWDHVT